MIDSRSIIGFAAVVITLMVSACGGGGSEGVEPSRIKASETLSIAAGASHAYALEAGKYTAEIAASKPDPLDVTVGQQSGALPYSREGGLDLLVD